jgi:hypothetical protein
MDDGQCTLFDHSVWMSRVFCRVLSKACQVSKIPQGQGKATLYTQVVLVTLWCGTSNPGSTGNVYTTIVAVIFTQHPSARLCMPQLPLYADGKCRGISLFDLSVYCIVFLHGNPSLSWFGLPVPIWWWGPFGYRVDRAAKKEF